MSNQNIAVARPTRLARVADGDHDNSSKLRVAGRIVSYDEQSAHIVIADGAHELLVDVSQCLEAESTGWARRMKTVVMVVGYVEHADDDVVGGVAQTAASSSEMTTSNKKIVLRALLIIPGESLSLSEWNEGIKALEEAEERAYLASAGGTTTNTSNASA